MKSMDDSFQQGLSLIETEAQLFPLCNSFSPKSKQRSIAEMPRKFLTDMDAWNVLSMNDKEQLKISTTYLDINMRKGGCRCKLKSVGTKHVSQKR